MKAINYTPIVIHPLRGPKLIMQAVLADVKFSFYFFSPNFFKLIIAVQKISVNSVIHFLSNLLPNKKNVIVIYV